MTSDGGYSTVSQADSGRMVALRGDKLRHLERDGRVIAEIATPVSTTVDPSMAFKGPFDPEISPDGRRVAYTYYWQYTGYDPYCNITNDCTVKRLYHGTGFTDPNRLTAWDEPGFLRRRALAQEGEEAIATLHEAVEAFEGTDLRLELGWALHDLGARLRIRGDRRTAREPLRRALDLGHRTESALLARHAHGELEASGARPRRERLDGVEALTPAERRVAQLAAEGLTNRQIAETLWVTLKTVEVHLGRS